MEGKVVVCGWKQQDLMKGLNAAVAEQEVLELHKMLDELNKLYRTLPNSTRFRDNKTVEAIEKLALELEHKARNYVHKYTSALQTAPSSTYASQADNIQFAARKILNSL